jgi:hypothetical protein
MAYKVCVLDECVSGMHGDRESSFWLIECHCKH